MDVNVGISDFFPNFWIFWYRKKAHIQMLFLVNLEIYHNVYCKILGLLQVLQLSEKTNKQTTTTTIHFHCKNATSDQYIF